MRISRATLSVRLVVTHVSKLLAVSERDFRGICAVEIKRGSQPIFFESCLRIESAERVYTGGYRRLGLRNGKGGEHIRETKRNRVCGGDLSYSERKGSLVGRMSGCS